MFEDLFGTGAANLRLLGTTSITPIDGGLPLIADGHIMRAIGVSGMLPTQEVQVAQARTAAM